MVLFSTYLWHSPVPTHGTPKSLPTALPSAYPWNSPVPTHGTPQSLPTALPSPYPRYSPVLTHGTPQSLSTVLSSSSPQQSLLQYRPTIPPFGYSPQYVTRTPTHDFPSFNLRMETEQASEALCSALVDTYQTARRHTPKDRNLVPTRNFKQVTRSLHIQRSS